jgi:hypothetical protein
MPDGNLLCRQMLPMPQALSRSMMVKPMSRTG